MSLACRSSCPPLPLLFMPANMISFEYDTAGLSDQPGGNYPALPSET